MTSSPWDARVSLSGQLSDKHVQSNKALYRIAQACPLGTFAWRCCFTRVTAAFSRCIRTIGHNLSHIAQQVSRTTKCYLMHADVAAQLQQITVDLGVPCQVLTIMRWYSVMQSALLSASIVCAVAMLTSMRRQQAASSTTVRHGLKALVWPDVLVLVTTFVLMLGYSIFLSVNLDAKLKRTREKIERVLGVQLPDKFFHRAVAIGAVAGSVINVATLLTAIYGMIECSKLPWHSSFRFAKCRSKRRKLWNVFKNIMVAMFVLLVVTMGVLFVLFAPEWHANFAATVGKDAESCNPVDILRELALVSQPLACVGAIAAVVDYIKNDWVILGAELVVAALATAGVVLSALRTVDLVEVWAIASALLHILLLCGLSLIHNKRVAPKGAQEMRAGPDVSAGAFAQLHLCVWCKSSAMQAT